MWRCKRRNFWVNLAFMVSLRFEINKSIWYRHAQLCWCWVCEFFLSLGSHLISISLGQKNFFSHNFMKLFLFIFLSAERQSDSRQSKNRINFVDFITSQIFRLLKALMELSHVWYFTKKSRFHVSTIKIPSRKKSTESESYCNWIANYSTSGKNYLNFLINFPSWLNNITENVKILTRQVNKDRIWR